MLDSFQIKTILNCLQFARSRGRSRSYPHDILTQRLHQRHALVRCSHTVGTSVLAPASCSCFRDGARHRSRDVERKQDATLQQHHFNMGKTRFQLLDSLQIETVLSCRQIAQASVDRDRRRRSLAAMTSSTTSPHRMLTPSGVCDCSSERASSLRRDIVGSGAFCCFTVLANDAVTI